jgi:glycine cleavage system H protein
VTHFAIEQLGDIVHVALPQIGNSFNCGEPFGSIESTKTVSDLYMPLSGTITAINNELITNPEYVHDDCYNGGWLIKINASDDDGELLDGEEYEAFMLET